MSRPSTTINVSMVKAATEKALLCVVDGAEVWIPRSQILDGDLDKRGDSGDLEIPVWLAEEKALL